MGYLVISRRQGQRIKIGAQIEIIIGNLDDQKVDVAICAPQEVKIEKVDRVKHPNRNKPERS